jgi:hypothetical protein
MARRREITSFVLLFTLLVAAPAAALQARITELRVAGGVVRASLEIRDLFPDKFRDVLERGGAIHLRLQLELWEDRAIWDKLAVPALVSVFRLILDPSTRQISVADRYGEAVRLPAWQEPLTLRLDLGRADALSGGTRYYVRTQGTLGTIAEREATDAGDAVFGRDEGGVTIGAVGRLLFHTVLQVTDYLQSVSSDARTRDVTGNEIKSGVRP